MSGEQSNSMTTNARRIAAPVAIAALLAFAGQRQTEIADVGIVQAVGIVACTGLVRMALGEVATRDFLRANPR